MINSHRRTDYSYHQTEQIAKTVIDLINSRTETSTTMEYNVQGRLSKITIDAYTNGQKVQSIAQEYTYNSSGIKVRQVENIDADANGTFDSQNIINYLTDAQNNTGYAQVLEERKTENGQEVKVTTYTIGHDVLSQFDSADGYLALLADGHGSTRGVANNIEQVVQQYSYDAYGNAIGFNARLAKTNLLYSGEQFNPVSGLQYLRARWYNPTSGVFNRLDPYSGNRQNPLSFHKYAYAHMNPVMGTDPSGKWFAGLIELCFATKIRAALTFSAINTVVNIGFDVIRRAKFTTIVANAIINFTTSFVSLMSLTVGIGISLISLGKLIYEVAVNDLEITTLDGIQMLANMALGVITGMTLKSPKISSKINSEAVTAAHAASASTALKGSLFSTIMKDLADAMKAADKKTQAVVALAYDTQTGKLKGIGYSGDGGEATFSTLRSEVKSASTNPPMRKTGAELANCAEPKLASNLLENGHTAKDTVIFSFWTKSGNIAKPCLDCTSLLTRLGYYDWNPYVMFTGGNLWGDDIDELIAIP
jgi:RHS repeat-associated core domain